jgi:hypothetical protein
MLRNLTDLSEKQYKEFTRKCYDYYLFREFLVNAEKEGKTWLLSKATPIDEWFHKLAEEVCPNDDIKNARIVWLNPFIEDVTDLYGYIQAELNYDYADKVHYDDVRLAHYKPWQRYFWDIMYDLGSKNVEISAGQALRVLDKIIEAEEMAKKFIGAS